MTFSEPGLDAIEEEDRTVDWWCRPCATAKTLDGELRVVSRIDVVRAAFTTVFTSYLLGKDVEPPFKVISVP